MGVLHRDEVGDIDIVWGDENGGWHHIATKHVGEGKSFRTEEEAIEAIENIVNNGEKNFENGDKIVFKQGDRQVVIRKNYRENGKKVADKNWVLTAYDEKAADGGVSAISTTNKGEAARATASSAGKGNNSSANGKKDDKITDFSEKIGGSRKDEAQAAEGHATPQPKISSVKNEFGKPFVLSSKGTIDMGVIDKASGLKEASIRLSEGEDTVDADGKHHGYGLIHIDAEHKQQILKAGYKSVVDFVEDVASNYRTIREGNVVANKQTYLLELTDSHNNTLYIELSSDGKYWNVNSAGVFRTDYSKNKKEVYTRPAVSSSSGTRTAGVNHGVNNSATVTSGNSPRTSTAKVENNSQTTKHPQAQRTDAPKPATKEQIAIRDGMAEHLNRTGLQTFADEELGQRIVDEEEQRIREKRAASPENTGIQFFRSSAGEILGFTVGGKIYLDPRKATPETAFHEYGHIWLEALKQGNRKEYDSLMQKVKDDAKLTPIWEEVKKNYPRLSDEALTEEVFVMYSGRKGSRRIEERIRQTAAQRGMDITQKATTISALQRLKQAIQNAWRGILDFLHINYKNVDEAVEQQVKDFIMGNNPLDALARHQGRYTAEEQSIIDSAKRNGTYMKAPNGKKSKLTPYQWVQTRTKAFKQWFGDWELAQKRVKVADATEMHFANKPR